MNDTIVALAPLLFWTVVLAIPMYYVLRKTGNSMWLFALVAIPMLGAVILLWILAFSPWPKVEGER